MLTSNTHTTEIEYALLSLLLLWPFMLFIGPSFRGYFKCCKETIVSMNTRVVLLVNIFSNIQRVTRIYSAK